MSQLDYVVPQRSEQLFTVLEACSSNNKFAAAEIPQHPFMAPNNFGSPHQDAWCSESVSLAGPTSSKLQLTLQRNPYGYTANMVCNSANQMIGVSFDYVTQTFYVVMFDADCNIISATPAGSRQGSTFGGGYFYLDNHDNTIVVQDNTIISYPTQQQELQQDIYALTPNWVSDNIVELVTNQANTLYSALPVWDAGLPNHYWCLISGTYDYDNYPDAILESPAYMAVVEVVAQGSGSYRTELRGKIELSGQWNNNTFAVDEAGAYIVTNGVPEHGSGNAGQGYLWAFEYQNGAVSALWKTAYQNAGYLKPGQKNIGSGTTPTLTETPDGTRLVAIADNADPQLHVLVCNRDTGEPVAEIPCFEKMRSADEASLIGVGNTFIAENNFAHYPTWPHSQVIPNGTGMSSITVNATGDNAGLETTWDMPNTHFYAMNMLCRASGIIFAHTCDWSSDESDEKGGMYYVSAIDSFNGRTIWRIPLGRGVDYCHEYGGIYFNKNGDLYIGTNKYIAKIGNYYDRAAETKASLI
ncbi:hypothetical protein [Arenicella xantha]|uniref:Uncharacterized protein n=1 Tax=Arenicella xantha TaxID=644221 RepID=A0A395JG46_9GAMM|nr:hypothetical protein [Arenicella xantha]RBP48752.1 hypothetical protein DFR28_10591 [Arenicella xantha]